MTVCGLQVKVQPACHEGAGAGSTRAHPIPASAPHWLHLPKRQESPLMSTEPASGVSVQDEEDKFTGWAVMQPLRWPHLPLPLEFTPCVVFSHSRAGLCDLPKYRRNMKCHSLVGLCKGTTVWVLVAVAWKPKMVLGSCHPGIHALVYNPFPGV